MINLAEFCLECFNKINETSFVAKDVIISNYLDVCEECGEWKKVVVCSRRTYYMYKLRFILFPFRVVFLIFYLIWRLFIIPYTVYKMINKKDASD